MYVKYFLLEITILFTFFLIKKVQTINGIIFENSLNRNFTSISKIQDSFGDKISERSKYFENIKNINEDIHMKYFEVHVFRINF